MERNGLIELSAELLRQIFEYVDNNDLKVIRLCGNHTITATASSLLFVKAYIAARRGVLTTFTALTTHPVLRDHVREITFDSSYIDPRTITEYKGKKSGPELARLFQEQETIQKDEMQNRLEEAFRYLTRVRKVIYADMSRVSFLPGDLNDRIPGEDYEDGPLLVRLQSGYLENVIDGNEAIIEAMDCCQLSKMPEDIRRRCGGLFVLIQVLSKYTCASLQDLRLGSVVNASRGGFGVPHVAFSSQSPNSVLKSFGQIFHSLRKLDISIANVTETLPVYGLEFLFTKNGATAVDVSNLCGALRLAVNLEMLKLCGHANLSYIHISDILSSLPVGRIKLLHFTYIAIDLPDLKVFLRKHSERLRHITLADVCLLSGVLDDFTTFSQQNLPYLEVVFGLVRTNVRKALQVDKLLPMHLEQTSPQLDIFQGKKNMRLRSWDLDRVGEMQYAIEKHEQDDQQEESEDESDSTEELEYTSDDSSSDTGDGPPRRKSDKDYFNTLHPDMQTKVAQLQKKLEGYQAYECVQALEGRNYEKALNYLTWRYGFTDLALNDNPLSDQVRVLMHAVSFSVGFAECQKALTTSGG